MVEAQTFEEVFPGVFQWEAYSPEHKVELTSHAVRLGDYLYCFDPIPLKADQAEELSRKGIPRAILLTNGNHERAAEQWQKRWNVPVWAAPEANLSLPGLSLLSPTQTHWYDAWELVRLPGAGPGEVAAYSADLSLLMVGDAIVNLPYRGLEILPTKYCVNRSLLEATLQGLPVRSLERLCSAHGKALVSAASKAIRAVLG